MLGRRAARPAPRGCGGALVPSPDPPGAAARCTSPRTWPRRGSNRQRCHRYLALAPMPPVWVAPDEEPPPTTHFICPPPPHSAAGDAAPGWLDALPAARPLVHATLGTTEVNRTPGLYEAILAGLVEEPIELVIGVGRQRDPGDFGPQPDHVHIAQYLPHAALLPRCDVVVTHGGFGTIMGSLSVGVPMVVVPAQADQPRNARRCVDLGVGRRTPGRALDDTAGPQPVDGPRRARRPVPIPRPRSGRAVHGVVRRGPGGRGYRSGQNSARAVLARTASPNASS